MPEFDIDDFKKSWQEQDVQPKYGSSEIIEMLNKKSRNYVKYILWISIAEFLILLVANIYYLMQESTQGSFTRIVERIGITQTDEIAHNFDSIYWVMKSISLLVTLFFVYRFFINYKRIRIEQNLKDLILQIIQFKNTVNAFIITNIALLVVFTSALVIYVSYQINHQSEEISRETYIGFIVGSVVTLVFCAILFWIYYKIIYGILMRRLGKNLKQLQEIEDQK